MMYDNLYKETQTMQSRTPCNGRCSENAVLLCHAVLHRYT